MTEEARREWLLVAWETLKHLPADILHRGCEAARKAADHPAKIVPAIMAEAEPLMDERRKGSSWADEWKQAVLAAPPKKHIMDRDRSAFTEADWAELSEHLEKMGSPYRYGPDGTRYSVAA